MLRSIFTTLTMSILTMSSFSVVAQTTVTFQPAGGIGKDARLVSCVPCSFNDNNYGNSDEISAIAWTFSSDESNARSLLEFDLTSIPVNAVVTSASLSLYHNPNPATGNMSGQHSSTSGSNASYIRQVTSAWSESTVTWDTQPTTTSAGQILLPQSSSGTQNYLDINVTNLVQNMVTTPAQNFGFMLQLDTETAYRGLLFASSDHTNASIRPKLVVTYILGASCTDPELPVIGGDLTLCNNSVSIFQIVSGDLNDATNWHWYSGSCGGTPIGTGSSMAISSPGTYYVRGEGACVTPGACQSFTVTQQIVTATVSIFEDSNLMSTQSDSYQWLNCDSSYNEINGATYQLYTPQNNGSYAVLVGQGDCFVVSDCFDFTMSSSPSSDSCIVYQPAGNVGKDARLVSCVLCGFNDNNYGNSDEMSSISWTFNGNESNGRSLLEFDLTAIPVNATITSASLSLYHNPNPATGNMDGEHSVLSGSNASYLKRVTSSWNENTVTWDSQPTTTNVDQVLLPQSTNSTQNYLNINVAQLVQTMVSSPSQNFGFMLELADESPYRGMIFASSDHSNANLRPKLEICYSVGDVNVSEVDFNQYERLTIFPNPSNGICTISLPQEMSDAKLFVFNTEGRLVHEDKFSGKESTLHLNIDAGVYVVRIINGAQLFTGKWIVE